MRSKRMKAGQSKLIKEISKLCEDLGVYSLKLLSGKMHAQHGERRATIQLCPVGTPEVFCLINGQPVFFLVKCDQKEIETWNRKIERFKNFARIITFDHQEVMQFKQMKKIEGAGGVCFVVCSVQEAELIIKNYL